jgi:hypothetical protein
MKVVIEGHLAQITNACRLVGIERLMPSIDLAQPREMEQSRIDRRRRRAENKARQDQLHARRQVLHRAYCLLLPDPAAKGLMADLVAALAGRAPLTETLVEAARAVINERRG